MMESNDRETTRRQWCCTAGRFLALGGIGWLSAALVGSSSRAAKGCGRQVLSCQACGQWRDCRLPEAVAARNYGAGVSPASDKQAGRLLYDGGNHAGR